MGFLLFAFLVFVFLSSVARATKSVKQDEYLVEATPVCPPHKWGYKEVKDTEGKVVKWKMVCDICGPLKPQTGPARTQ